jgi:hypothetical protein
MRCAHVFGCHVVAAVVVFCFCSLAHATPEPISPEIYPSPNSAGQSTLVESAATGNSSVFVDWMVLPYDPASGLIDGPSGPAYLYLYQVENPAAANSNSSISLFTVQFPSGAPDVLAAGMLPGDDLDNLTSFHPAHDVSNFPVLAGEFEPANEPAGTITADTSIPSLVNWILIPGVGGQHESFTMYFVDAAPPVYGTALAQGAIQWNNLGHGDGVPVPIPEPSSMLLAALAGFTLLGVGRRCLREPAPR